MSKRHVGKHWNKCLQKGAPSTHILNLLIRWVEEFGRADAIARREPVVSIMPFLLYCAAVSMAHLTVCGQTLRQAAG